MIPAVLIKSLKALGYTAVGALFAVVIGGIWLLESRPDLDVWHTARLDEEFTENSDVASFAEYLALEDRLFKQLDEQVYGRIAQEKRRLTMRYRRGSAADPARWPQDWNRSYATERARAPRRRAAAARDVRFTVQPSSDRPVFARARRCGRRPATSGSWHRAVGTRLDRGRGPDRAPCVSA